MTGSVLKFDGFLKVYEESKEGKDEEDEELKHKLPALEPGQKLTLKRIEARAAFHRAAAALQRSFAGEGTRRARHRPAVHLFRDSQHHPGAPVRAEAGRQIYADGNRPGGHRSAGRKISAIFSTSQYTARLEEELDEIEEGKETWTDALADFYKKFAERSPLCRKAHGKHQADGEAHRREVRALRSPAGDQVGQARIVLRLQFLRQRESRKLHLHQRKSRSTCPISIPPTCRRPRRKSIAKIAAG